MEKKTKITTKQEPVYKQVWFWVVMFTVFMTMIVIANNKQPESTSNTDEMNQSTEIEEVTAKDYVGKDAKLAYNELISDGFAVKFVFDRPNQGGFTEESFQDFVLNDSFAADSYSEMPLVVTRQINHDKSVVLYLEYKSIVDGE